MANQDANALQHAAGLIALAVPAYEQHYSTKELAELWGLSTDCIRDLFVDEPGTLKIKRPEKLHKRVYCTLRIPKSVAHRVHARMQAK